MNQQDKNKFFNELAVAMGVDHLSTAKQYYYGMIKMVSRTIREEGELQLPDFGTFLMRDYKAKRIGDVRSDGFLTMPAQKVLKFKPDYKLNYYVKN